MYAEDWKPIWKPYQPPEEQKYTASKPAVVSRTSEEESKAVHNEYNSLAALIVPSDTKDDFKLNLFPEQMSIGGSKPKDDTAIEIDLKSDKSKLSQLVEKFDDGKAKIEEEDDDLLAMMDNAAN